MSAIQLDILQAIEAKDKGIQTAITHANAVVPDWSDKAYAMLVEWLKDWPEGFTFMIEDFRKICQIKKLPDPPTARAFGAIAVRAKIAGLIKSNGQKPTTGISGHGCYANQWMKI